MTAKILAAGFRLDSNCIVCDNNPIDALTAPRLPGGKLAVKPYEKLTGGPFMMAMAAGLGGTRKPAPDTRTEFAMLMARSVPVASVG